MNGIRFSQRTVRYWIVFFCLLAWIASQPPTARAQGGFDPTVQTQTLLYDEARTVYLGNLARRNNGVPPLRWNLQLTHAARWFSWDSVENRPSGFCGHQDTQGNWPSYRALAFGYLGGAGAENAYCGYMTPESAINGWMNSSGHRANLLDPNSREIGLGYYRRSGDGRGYVTQDFGNDAVYAPVIIENEAISTTSPNVNLYIYDRSSGGGFGGFGAATQMMVSNNAHLGDASWEPYTANKAWTLSSGEGWQEVYVKTRDIFDRTLTVSDTIYLGATVPLSELGDAQMSTTQAQVTLYSLDGGALPQAQFSLGWLADDTFGTFNKWWGNGERVNDAAAWGGTSYRLYPGNGESFAWVYDTTFIKNTPMVAYFRLKVNNNTSSNEVARLSIQGGSTEYGPLSLKGTDFTASDQYQEFPINFTFNATTNDPFLIFKFWQSGTADLYVDAVSIFTMPQAITSPFPWNVPGNNYRGQGVWVRYTDGVHFSGITEGDTLPLTISGNAGAPGVTLSYTDGAPRTVIAKTDGSYSLSISDHWGGTVTPSLPGVDFTPANRTYTDVTTDLVAQDYIATITISGNTGVGAVTLNFTDEVPSSFTSDSNGNYSIALPYGWTGSIIPRKAGYVFYPPSLFYTKVSADQIAQDYQAAAILTVPGPVSPAQGSHVLELRPGFDWSDVPNTGYYTIAISQNDAFTQLVVNETSVSSAFTPRQDLLANTVLYWRVRAEGLGGPSHWSQVRSFTTPNPPGIPTLISPNPNAITVDLRPAFKWRRAFVPHGTQFNHFQIQVGTDQGFSTPVIDATLTGAIVNTYAPPADMAPDTKYYWRMRAFNTDNEVSSWSDVRTFTTPRPVSDDNRLHAYSVDPALPAPEILDPLDETSLHVLQPVLDWTDVPGATSYIVQVSSDPMFTPSSLVVTATTVDSRYRFIKDAPSRVSLYWRVLTISGTRVSEWSSVHYFAAP